MQITNVERLREGLAKARRVMEAVSEVAAAAGVSTEELRALLETLGNRKIDSLTRKHSVTESTVKAVRTVIDDEEQVELICSLSDFGYSQYELCKVATMLKGADLRLIKNSEDHKPPCVFYRFASGQFDADTRGGGSQ